ncbi:FAD-binding protein, partial [Corynebacterium heidelbergense]|uniref:FAD-binding protein n=1 Tax=Corynebacterium heidelbergense TaxID=2055947 RepID=UPI001EE6ED8C
MSELQAGINTTLRRGRGRWRNWSGVVRATPQDIVQPRGEAQLAELLATTARSAERVRAVGAGHSFTALAATEGVLVNLDRMQGLVGVDPAARRVTLGGGPRLRKIPNLLRPHGVALPNQGDVDPQSITGAINTGTHGTGVGYTGFAGLVRGFRIALASGEIRQAHPDAPDKLDRDLFHYGRIGLGALGIVTQVDMDVAPSFVLAAREHAEPVADITRNFPNRVHAADHVEFYWFPGTDVAHVKTNTRHPADHPTQPIS